MVTKELPY